MIQITSLYMINLMAFCKYVLKGFLKFIEVLVLMQGLPCKVPVEIV